MRRRQPQYRKHKKMVAYSKRVIAAMIVLWFAGAAFAGIVVSVQLFRKDYTVSIDSLLNYIGMPMTGGIVGYLIKSAIENKEKIKEAYDPDYDNRKE